MNHRDLQSTFFFALFAESALGLMPGPSPGCGAAAPLDLGYQRSAEAAPAADKAAARAADKPLPTATA